MRSQLPLLGFGFIVGVTVGGLVLWGVRQDTKRTQSNPGALNQAASVLSVPNPARDAFDWRTVESEEYPKYIANLRGIGCPEETIRDIIVADVNKLFEDRRKSLFGTKTNRLEYWKSWAQRKAQAFDEERVKAQQELAREKRAVLKTLLGVELEEKADLMTMTPLDEEFDFLSLAKRTAVIEVEQQFTARRLKLMMSGADMNELRKLEQERDAQIATLLSAEELEDYQLRRSTTAGRMAWELAAFEPTEREFREIFKLRRQAEDEFGLTANDTLGSAATAKLDEELKRLLGDTRYAEYERSQDSTYQAVCRVADKNGFPKEAANKIYELRKAAIARAGVVRQDDSLSREQRLVALSAIRAEADTAAHALFGHEAILALEGQGSWLGQIVPPAAVQQ